MTSWWACDGVNRLTVRKSLDAPFVSPQNHLMNIFSQVFNSLPRQGPGSTADTLRALTRARDGVDPIEKILDVGCGCGAQTMALLSNTAAQVTAVDLSHALLERLQKSAQAEGVDGRLTSIECSMEDMPLAPNSQAALIMGAR